eukprot:1147689-Pelagomonas_calceolata.AAC.1
MCIQDLGMEVFDTARGYGRLAPHNREESADDLVKSAFFTALVSGCQFIELATLSSAALL